MATPIDYIFGMGGWGGCKAVKLNLDTASAIFSSIPQGSVPFKDYL